jgi:hypothetical protein
MKFEATLFLFQSEPLLSIDQLLRGSNSLNSDRVQVARWVAAGKLLKVCRGLYCLAAAARACPPHPFYVALRIARHFGEEAYISLESALRHHGVMAPPKPDPSGNPLPVTCVCAGRPRLLRTPLGEFSYRRIKEHFFGIHLAETLVDGWPARVASPEKALLDLLYLAPYSFRWEFLDTLHLLPVPVSVLDSRKLILWAQSLGSTKLRRAAAWISLRIRAAQRRLTSPPNPSMYVS